MVTAARIGSSPGLTFDSEPTPTNTCLPSLEKTTERVSCPPPGRASKGSASPVAWKFWIVLEADQLLHGADVNIVIVKSDTKRTRQTGGELLAGLGAAVILRIAQNYDLSSTGISYEDVIVRSNNQPAGSLKSGCKNIILNPAGTVGRNPSGGLTLLGEFADDFVAYGAGNTAFSRESIAPISSPEHRATWPGH